jgi:small-conductance mechanosensitive channel
MQDFLQSEFLGNSVSDYGVAIATIVIGIIITKIVQTLVVGRLKRWARRTSHLLDDDFIKLVERSLIPLIYLGLFYLSLRDLRLHPILDRALNVISVILLTIIIVQFLGSLVEYALQFYLVTRKSGKLLADSPNLEPTLNALVPAFKIIVWAIGIVFLLDNLGFDISAVVTGLGIGGVAVALASQGILQDLFSYFSILFDRPFDLGDFIIVGDCIGTVEYIGIKTTRLRSLDGEQIIIANTDLTGSRIRNYMRMSSRRIVFHLGVTYETGLNRLQDIPGLIQSIIETVDQVEFDRAHFRSYGDFSLNFEVVYLVMSSDYKVYMDAQQAINFGIKRSFDEQGIEFAYPTQVTYLNRVGQSDAFTTATQEGNGQH